MILLSYFLLIQPSLTIRKFISVDFLNKIFPLLVHPSFQDFFSKLFSACDDSLNICTEYRIKLLEYLKLTEFGQLVNQVIIGKKRLDQASQSPFCQTKQCLSQKKKIGKNHKNHNFFIFQKC